MLVGCVIITYGLSQLGLNDLWELDSDVIWDNGLIPQHCGLDSFTWWSQSSQQWLRAILNVEELFKASRCVTFVIVLLTKANHMVKPRTKRWRNSIAWLEEWQTRIAKRCTLSDGRNYKWYFFAVLLVYNLYTMKLMSFECVVQWIIITIKTWFNYHNDLKNFITLQISVSLHFEPQLIADHLSVTTDFLFLEYNLKEII